MSLYLGYIYRFLGLYFFQVLLLKNLGYYNLATPFVYILFILRLPSKTNEFVLYLVSFLLGLMVDTTYNTLGVHATSCVVLAYVRLSYLKFALIQDRFESETDINHYTLGMQWFWTYATVLTFAHHFITYLMEFASFSDLFYLLLRSILSTIFSIFFMIIIEILFLKKARST